MSIPKGQDPETVTLEQAIALVEAKVAGDKAAVRSAVETLSRERASDIEEPETEVAAGPSECSESKDAPF